MLLQLQTDAHLRLLDRHNPATHHLKTYRSQLALCPRDDSRLCVLFAAKALGMLATEGGSRVFGPQAPSQEEFRSLA